MSLTPREQFIADVIYSGVGGRFGLQKVSLFVAQTGFDRHYSVVRYGAPLTRDQASQVVTSVFEECYHSFVRYACRATGNPHSAEEVVQDVLMALFAELRRGKPVEHPRAWCLVVLQRKINRERRRIYAAPLRSLEDVEALNDMAGLSAPPPGDAADVPELLTHLTMREQEVMLLRMESLKYREIARVLGISKNTVNALLARGLGKLQALVRSTERAPSPSRQPLEKIKSATTLQ
jgi:RNA polymerase sigma-70 factor, ECF subfamily